MVERHEGVGDTGPKDTAPREPATGGVLPPRLNGSWSRPARLWLAAVIVVTAMAVTIHLLLLFLYLAPANAISKEHRELVNSYVYPEFDQNWKLFAPNPLQGNIYVDARAEVEMPDGSRRTSDWVALTGQDIESIQDNPAPSHADQNLLRQAWDFYTRTHDAKGLPVGLQGQLSEAYVRRIAAGRLGPGLLGGQVVKVQLRSTYRPIAPPRWSDENDVEPVTYQTLTWWPVSKEDFR
ncbi:DUF5819 family protein [Streptomyces sp. NRRL F-2799]|uniref:DUF5819 family protein n=1 Tax=Streptomyces sp. NRRL F-2799 TaxID=1463844 RepID=UPI0004C6E18A|nr:DUF5819 family protein [Streptomyces sp. NRRL F-2799]